MPTGLRVTVAVLVVAAIAGPCTWALDQPARRAQLGQQVYEQACLACHGSTGSGAPQALLGFHRPSSFPNFSQCSTTAPEYTRDWRAVIVNGGRARGYSEIMPAFGDALTAEQIDAVIGYLRSLCADPDWAPGELNAPRALLTEKAYPEDELVVTTSVDSTSKPAVGNTLTYERQFGARNQLEVELPYNFARAGDGSVQGGLSDMVAGIKRVMFYHYDPTRDAGDILSLQGEITLPTGSPSRALGTGQTALGAFAAYDIFLPGKVSLQWQAGGDEPLHTAPGARDVYARMAIGKSFPAGAGLGRLWSPMVEVIAHHDLQPGAVTDWSVIPQLEVTLSTRQHVSANLGYEIAVNEPRQRSNTFMLYILWDTLDGSLFAGW